MRALLLALLLVPGAAMAHTGEGVGGLASGFLHPVLGLDHVVAMVAVGLWAAVLGGRALLVLPLAFPLVLAAGAALGMAGVALPAVETGIALSGVVLGLLVATATRAPLGVAAAIVAAFAVVHGHAHGAEIPEAAGPLAYGLGFVAGTTLLHLLGVALGALSLAPRGRDVVRGAGVTVAAVGGAFLLGVV